MHVNTDSTNTTQRDDSLALIDLDAQSKPVAQVRLEGALHNLRPINMAGLRALRSMHTVAKGDEGAQIEILRGIIRSILPTLDDEGAGKLDLQQMMQLVTRSAVSADKVEAIIRAVQQGKDDAPVSAATTAKAAAPSQ